MPIMFPTMRLIPLKSPTFLFSSNPWPPNGFSDTSSFLFNDDAPAQ